MKNASSCRIPSKRSLSVTQTLTTIINLERRIWLKAILIAMAAALLIGIPTVLIPNSLFQRMIPTTPIDYVFYVVSVLLIGLTWAIPLKDATGKSNETRSPKEKQSVFGLIATIFAVGCPTCNQLVLLLLGTGGAMTYFAPVQPLIGFLAIALLFFALMKRVASL